MFLPASGDPWSWSEDAFPSVAFCVEALVHDGLIVPPFDQHHDGDGSLRRVGLDVATWREWVLALVRQRSILSTVARDLARGHDRDELVATARAAGEVLTAPGSLCPGPRELPKRLNTLWVEYQPMGEAWKRQMTTGEGGVRHRSTGRALWNALVPFHGRLPTLSVFLVAYPVPTVMALPPTTCLIAPAHGSDAYGRQVVEAARMLSAVV